MTTVFIAGSMKIKHLDRAIKERIDNIVASDFSIIIGDADGADSSIQRYLVHAGNVKATVFCSGDMPRNNLGNWPAHVVDTQYAKGSRAFFTAKDICMAEKADYGLMIWDSKSTGTLSNVIELLSRKKKSVVFVNKLKAFFNVGSVNQLQQLISIMSDDAKRKAEEKINLSSRIESLNFDHVSPQFDWDQPRNLAKSVTVE